MSNLTLWGTLLSFTLLVGLLNCLLLLGQRKLGHWLDQNPRGWRIGVWVFGMMTLSLLTGICVLVYVALAIMLLQMGGWL